MVSSATYGNGQSNLGQYTNKSLPKIPTKSLPKIPVYSVRVMTKQEENELHTLLNQKLKYENQLAEGKELVLRGKKLQEEAATEQKALDEERNKELNKLKIQKEQIQADARQKVRVSANETLKKVLPIVLGVSQERIASMTQIEIETFDCDPVKKCLVINQSSADTLITFAKKYKKEVLQYDLELCKDSVPESVVLSLLNALPQTNVNRLIIARDLSQTEEKAVYAAANKLAALGRTLIFEIP